MLALPSDGSYWSSRDDYKKLNNRSVGAGEDVANNNRTTQEIKTYRSHFLQSEHFNFYSKDSPVGPVVLSLKYTVLGGTRPGYQIRVLLRLTGETVHQLVTCDTESSPLQLASLLCPELSSSVTSLHPVFCPDASELLLKYDE